MSGFHTPKWFDFLLSAVDVAHKAVHPSRWGEGKRNTADRELAREIEAKRGPARPHPEPPRRMPTEPPSNQNAGAGKDDHEDGGP